MKRVYAKTWLPLHLIPSLPPYANLAPGERYQRIMTDRE
jgi:hypothetical protein